MLRIESGYKTYRGNLVLNNLNVCFKNGHVYGLVGINGSGKTTILKALSGYIKLDKGFVFQDGERLRFPDNYISNAGVLIENPSFISYLTLLENLELIKSICKNKKKINLNDWINLYNLENFKDTPYRNLSLGTKKKMGLIQAFMDFPEILILDEPMNALDSESVRITEKIILNCAKSGLVVISSHLSQDINNLCNIVYKVEDGQILKKEGYESV